MSKLRSRVFRGPRIWKESDLHYFQRRRENIAKISLQQKLSSWVDIVLRRIYTWAGHVARMQEYDAQRLIARVLSIRDHQWCQTVAALHPQQHQSHPSRYYAHNWESQFARFFDERYLVWKEVARDRQQWHSYMDEWINSRYLGRWKSSIKWGRRLAKRKKGEGIDDGNGTSRKTRRYT